MPRSRTVLAVAACAAAIVLSLSACGGGEDTSQRQESIDSLMQEMSESGIPESERECIRTGLDDFSDEELVTLQTGQDESDVPVELQDKVVSMMTNCLMGTE
jgi:hypothetical protein